jgi:hypothetical protein
MQVAVENKRRKLLTSQSVHERQIHATHRASLVARKPTTGAVAETRHGSETNVQEASETNIQEDAQERDTRSRSWPRCAGKPRGEPNAGT